MRLVSKILDEIHNSLVQNWRDNKKWVLYPANKNQIKADNLMFFDNLHKADVFCNRQALKGRHWQYKPLVDVLRSLNKIHSNQQPSTYYLDWFCFENYQPLIEEISKEKLLAALIAGEIHPVYWKKVVNPMSAIHTYHILKVRFQQENGICKCSKQIVASCASYTNAINLFSKSILKTCLSGDSIKFHLVLLGQIKNKLLLSKEAVPLKNTGIVLLTTPTHSNGNNKTSSFNAIKVNDLSSPIVVKQPIFVRFNHYKTKLEFFDDKLCRITPGVDFAYFGIKYFDYTDALSLIKQWQKQMV